MTSKRSPDETRHLRHLARTIVRARDVVGYVADAYKSPWALNPSTMERAVLGHWLVRLVRHLAAIDILCSTRDLSMIASVHRRQMFEIKLQIRKYLAQNAADRSALADKISLWGCYEYLEKVRPGREHPGIARGYEWMQRKIAGYEPSTCAEVLRERQSGQRQWFGKSYSQLAREVSRGSENLSALYHLLSAEAHGTWVLATEVASPEPGRLDFRGYPDKATMYRWAAEVLDYATHLYLESWNEVAGAVGAPVVSGRTGPRGMKPRAG